MRRSGSPSCKARKECVLSVSSLFPHTTTLEWVIFLLDLTLQVSGLSGTGTFGFLDADSLHRLRWAACQIDYLCELPSDKARRKALTGLPPSLFETYDRILGRILDCPPDTQMVCRKTLHWIGLFFFFCLLFFLFCVVFFLSV